jgi:adenylate kinase
VRWAAGSETIRPFFVEALLFTSFTCLSRLFSTALENMTVSRKVIYLTGAPASGKTTTAQRLLQLRSDIELWDYSRRLRKYVDKRYSKKLTHDALRRESATIIQAEDIAAVDAMLIDFISQHRDEKHVIIDSHPVTREDYGFRCTAFSADQVQAVSLSEIWVLYTDPQTTIERMRADPGGRKEVDVEAARMHTHLQSAVATSYGIVAGKPVYFFDSTTDQEGLVTRLAKRLP